MKRIINKYRHKYRKAEILGVADLAAAAAEILSEIGATQDRDTVKELPDERTVRYYMSQGLIPPAEDKQGVTSVFAFHHVLTLLVIKMLQADGLTIKKIREIVVGKSERELERLLAAVQTPSAKGKNEAQAYLESLLTDFDTREEPHVWASSFHASRPRKDVDANMLLFSLPMHDQTYWHRYTVEPSLEVHIEDSFIWPDDREGIRALERKVIRTLRKARTLQGSEKKGGSKE